MVEGKNRMIILFFLFFFQGKKLMESTQIRQNVRSISDNGEQVRSNRIQDYVETSWIR